MKKLLTVSLFAIMAVSAANADIASTEYVGDQITATAGTLSSLATSSKANLVSAINEVKAEITTVSGDSAGWKSNLEQSISDLSDVVDGKADKATTLDGYGITDAMTATAITAAISEATDDMATNTGVAASIKEVTNVMATDDEVSTAVSTLEGKITTAGADTTALAGRVTTAEGKITTIEAQQTTQDGKIQDLENALRADGTTGKAIADNAAAISAINNAETGILAKAQQYADANDADTIYNDTEVRGLITTNANDIDAIENSDYATSGVTAAVVGQVTTNQNAIATINDSAVMNSGVDADVVAKANSAMQEAGLKALDSWTSAGCNAANATCSLVSKNGSIAWEKVSY